MADYFFSTCPDEAYPQIEAKAALLGLQPVKTAGTPEQWMGHPFQGGGYEGMLLISIRHKPDIPLFIQTAPARDHTDEELARLLRELAGMCGTDTAYNHNWGNPIQIDLAR